MADLEKSSAQRQARIRREKREAKIKSGGQERLDKITKLSGRTPESMRADVSPVSTPTPASPAVIPSPPASIGPPDAEQLRQQEEFLRAMLRSQPSQQPGQADGQAPGQDPEDPMVKMLNSILGGMSEDPNAPNSGLPSFSPDDIAKATGLPSFVTNMMMGKDNTPDPAKVKEAQLWKLIHSLFALVVGIYTLFTVSDLTSTFGDNPPAPATVRNPFVIFITGELLLHTARSFSSGHHVKRGFSFWLQTIREVGRDGAVMVFLMGAYTWWHSVV